MPIKSLLIEEGLVPSEEVAGRKDQGFRVSGSQAQIFVWLLYVALWDFLVLCRQSFQRLYWRMYIGQQGTASS